MTYLYRIEASTTESRLYEPQRPWSTWIRLHEDANEEDAKTVLRRWEAVRAEEAVHKPGIQFRLTRSQPAVWEVVE